MTKIALILTSAIVAFSTSKSPAAILFDEDFDNSTEFSSTAGFFSDGSGDYFGITGPGEDFGAGSTPAVKAYTGFSDNFLVGEDLDGEGAGLPIVIDFNPFSITNFTTLEFSGMFAEFAGEAGGIDASGDSILLEYQIDGNGFQNLLAFEGADFTSGSFNGIFRQDTDFNGTGDGTALSSAAGTFVVPISETGDSFALRLSLNVNAGSEDFAIDRFQVMGTAAVPEPSSAVLALVAFGMLGAVCIRRRAKFSSGH